MNIPEAVLPPDYDAGKENLVFDFSKQDSILEKTKRYLETKEMKEKTAKMDKLFDRIGLLIFCFHVFMAYVGVYL